MGTDGVSKGDVEWMVQKLASSGLRVRVVYWRESSVPKYCTERSVTGVVDDFEVTTFDSYDKNHDITFRFKSGCVLQAKALARFADGFYGMEAGNYPSCYIGLKVIPKPTVVQRLFKHGPVFDWAREYGR